MTSGETGNFRISLDERKLQELYSRIAPHAGTPPNIVLCKTRQLAASEKSEVQSNKVISAFAVIIGAKRVKGEYKPDDNEIILFTDNFTCRYAQNATFLKREVLETLTHEMGHALSLKGPSGLKTKIHNFMHGAITTKCAFWFATSLCGLLLIDFILSSLISPAHIQKLLAVAITLPLLFISSIFMWLLSCCIIRELMADLIRGNILKKYLSDLNNLLEVKPITPI